MSLSLFEVCYLEPIQAKGCFGVYFNLIELRAIACKAGIGLIASMPLISVASLGLFFQLATKISNKNLPLNEKKLPNPTPTIFT